MIKLKGIKTFLAVSVLTMFLSTSAWGKLCNKTQLGEIKTITAESQYITFDRAIHILCGDKTGGGHFYPGYKGKTAFPQNWTIRDILASIEMVVANTTTQDWYGPQSNGNYYTVWEKYRGDQDDQEKTAITLKVVIRKNCMVVTAYPQK